MDIPNFSRSRGLNNVPIRKLTLALEAVEASTDTLENQSLKKIAINRYAESNIPVEYWYLKMEKDFVGDPRLKALYEDYITDLNVSYNNATSICLAGGHGRGKTMAATCILKKASQKGFSCLYTTLSDIVSVLTSSGGDDRFVARKELIEVNFLVIDEWDQRFMPTENAADLYARSLESIFRARSQNKQPTIMCTNSPNVVESFSGPLKVSIDSLMKGYLKEFVVMGEDFRKKAK